MGKRPLRVPFSSQTFGGTIRDCARVRFLYRKKQRGITAQASGLLYESNEVGNGKTKGANAKKYQNVPHARLCDRRGCRDTGHLRKENILNTDLLLKVAGIGILVTVAYQILHKTGRDEQAMLVSVAGLIIVLLMLVREMGGLFDSVRSIFGL